MANPRLVDLIVQQAFSSILNNSPLCEQTSDGIMTGVHRDARVALSSLIADSAVLAQIRSCCVEEKEAKA